MANDQTGNNFQERLFYPFGERWTGSDLNNFNPHQTFAQLPDYDSETDEYNTLARHYNPMGHWMSPDPGGLKVVHTDDPQTWNMYAYVRNNPTTLTDPSGLYGVACSSDYKTCQKLADTLAAALQQTQKSNSDDIKKAGQAYGTLGDMNGVTVTFADTVDKEHPNVVGEVTAQPGTGGALYDENTKTFRQATQVTLNPRAGAVTFEERVIHEGVHVENRATIVNSVNGVFDPSLNITGRQSEMNAYGVENIFRRSTGLPTLNIQDILAHPPYSDNPNIDKPLFPDLPGPERVATVSAFLTVGSSPYEV